MRVVRSSSRPLLGSGTTSAATGTRELTPVPPVPP